MNSRNSFPGPGQKSPGPKRPGTGRPGDASSPLPDGWLKNLLQKADLEASLKQLDGYEHFFADAMRGHIRALQLRFKDAWRHFDAAYRKTTTKADESIPNLVRQFLLNIYCFDNALMEAPLTKDEMLNLPDFWIPDLPDEVLADYPEVKLVVQLRRNCDGILRLHLGDYAASLEIFEALVAENSTVMTKHGRGNRNALMMNYVGLAAAQLNLELHDEARRNLENAAFTVQSGGELINRARTAAILNAFHTYLGDVEDAADWKMYLERLPCPRATVQTFLKRAQIIHQRCSQRSSLVLL